MAQKKKFDNKSEKVVFEDKAEVVEAVETKTMKVVNGFTTIIIAGKETKASEHSARVLIKKGIAKLK